MPLQDACSAFTGESNFRLGNNSIGVWFEENTTGVYRCSNNGKRVIMGIQELLGADADGAWGPDTNARLRDKFVQFGGNGSVFRDGAISKEMLETAIAIARTLQRSPTATALTTTVCVPPATVLPRWNRSGANPSPAVRGISTMVEASASGETAVPQLPWRRPAGSEVIDAGVDDADQTFLTYRTADGQVRHALMTADRMLLEDRPATAAEAAGNTSYVPNDANDPGSLRPGETNPPTTNGGLAPSASTVAAAAAAEAAAKKNRILMIGGAIVGALLIGAIVSMSAAPKEPVDPITESTGRPAIPPPEPAPTRSPLGPGQFAVATQPIPKRRNGRRR